MKTSHFVSNKRPEFRLGLTLFLIFGIASCLPGPLSLVPNVDAASVAATQRLVKKLRKQIESLKAQLATALRPEPVSPPFIDLVTVGNPGNTMDPEDGDSFGAGMQNFGAVPYEFKIGKCEVTLTQYAAFLNAVAVTDTYGLYNANLATDENIAGIERSGTSGSYTYRVIGSGNRPVTYVNWFDAARFCNWLHNGRPTGAQDTATTEMGAYSLNGSTSGGFTITRNPGAKVWVPSEDEWYKAAYHSPGGTGDDYFLYPTGSDTRPGNAIGALANQANSRTPNNFYSITQSADFSSTQNYLTDGGSYSGSGAYYGTFDQGGNVFEWNDAVISDNRGARGGSWGDSGDDMRASTRLRATPNLETDWLGFRIAAP
jgi:formylglycine-generating enzyme